jgi:hypothetical protein
MATKKKAAAKKTAGTPKKPKRKARSKSTPAPRLVADTSIAPWAVSPEQIRILGDRELNALMRNLLLAKVTNGALGNLALRFWNWWPLEPRFIVRLEGLAGCSLAHVETHI